MQTRIDRPRMHPRQLLGIRGGTNPARSVHGRNGNRPRRIDTWKKRPTANTTSPRLDRQCRVQILGLTDGALCCFKVCLHVEKRETIVLKEGRTESDE
jgi:hypothetical protein